MPCVKSSAVWRQNTDNMLRVPHYTPQQAEELDQLFAKQPLHPIASNNWAEAYPYAPKAGFRLFHTSENLYLRFEVEERYTQALVEEDNGKVWTDSCVEFFLSFGEEGYYNFETTCIGRMLLAFRKEKPSPTYASNAIMERVERIPTLGTTPFPERVGDNRWQLTLKIPTTALFCHRIESWSGLRFRANFYKCGDDLSQPHFLSWKAIESESPNFHLPAFFGELLCE